MKKKLLVIVLAFCCVWGVFASKLADAAASGDFDTMKKQIELLDYDVKDSGLLLQICMCNWSCSDDTDWEQTQNYKKCVDYLMSKGAAMGKGSVIIWGNEKIEESRQFNAYYGKYDFKKIDYMYKMKYDNVNREWDSEFFPNWKEKTSRVDELLSLDQWGSKGDGDYEVQLLMLMQYNPIVKKTDSWKYDLLSADMATIKKRLRNGAKYEDLQLLLFINNPKIIELLETAEAYKLPDYFNGRITPYLINEIVPKYCTHITSKEEIAFMKFITNYNFSMDHEKSLAFVKDLISKGLDLNATPKILGGIRLSMLPVYIKNTDGVKLIMEVYDLPLITSSSFLTERFAYGHYNNEIGRYEHCAGSYGADCYNKYVLWQGTTKWIISYCKEDGMWLGDSIVIPSEFGESLKRIMNEKAEQERIERERKAEEERIARKKAAEEARIAQEMKAENDLMTNYLPKFSDNVREILMSYGSVKKGEYKVKNKKFELLATKHRLYSVYNIYEKYYLGYFIFVTKTEKKSIVELYSFPKDDGYTVEMVQKVWNMAVDQVCDEYGLQ